MITDVGLWIDHRKAVIVQVDDDALRSYTVESHLGRHTRPAGGSRSSAPYGPQDVVAEDHMERRFRQALERYYERVSSGIRSARIILIMGPGEAKEELQRHILRTRQQPKPLIELRPADKMTEPQIQARVRQYFRSG